MAQRTHRPSILQGRWRYSAIVATSLISSIVALDAFWLRAQAQKPTAEVKLLHQLINASQSLDEHSFTHLHIQLKQAQIKTELLNKANLHVEHLNTDKPTLLEMSGDTFWILCQPNGPHCLLIEANLAKHSTKTPYTILFYSIVGILIFSWLSPIFKGLNALEEAALVFSKTAKKTDASSRCPYPIKPLAEHFDAMAAQIESSIQTQKDMTHGLSHELRTPLARMKFALASIDIKPHQNVLINSIKVDIKELEQLTDTILRYARLEALYNQISIHSLDTHALLADLAQNNTYNKTVALKTHIACSKVQGDYDTLKLAINNLVKNSFRHANTKIDVYIEQNKTEYRLTVQDDGNGIDDIHSGFSLLPFNKSSCSDGVGFGLAFCDRVMKLHHGNIKLYNLPHGFKAVLTWPKKSPLKRALSNT